MSDSRITSFIEIQDHFPDGHADPWNVMIVTECEVYDKDDRDVPYTDGIRLQMAGFIIHPRRLDHEAFEIVTEVPSEVEYLMECVKTSAGALAMATSHGAECARQSFLAQGFGCYAKKNDPEPMEGPYKAQWLREHGEEIVTVYGDDEGHSGYKSCRDERGEPVAIQEDLLRPLTVEEIQLATAAGRGFVNPA